MFNCKKEHPYTTRMKQIEGMIESGYSVKRIGNEVTIQRPKDSWNKPTC